MEAQDLAIPHIPKDLASYDQLRQQLWRKQLLSRLADVKQALSASPMLKVDQQATIVANVSAFVGADDQRNQLWTTQEMQEVAEDILAFFTPPTEELLVHVLTNQIKPIFSSSPHPLLNERTGRKLPRPAGGPMASQDYYQAQSWKDHLGAENVILWCLRYVQPSHYEKLWHLIVPPIMAFLDDYQALYKLKGVHLVSEMLKSVPGDLLKRTGVDQLIYDALTNCIHFLNDPNTAPLVNTSISAMIQLIESTTKTEPAKRFDQLCSLLGEAVIGTIWLYASDDLAVMQASTDALPSIIRALGAGATRYLKVLIPQLIHSLTVETINSSRALQLSSVRALEVLIEEVPAERVARWKGTIVSGVARAWVILSDTKPPLQHHVAEQNGDLEKELQKICDTLSERCPGVLEDEYKRLIELDEALFCSLFLPVAR